MHNNNLIRTLLIIFLVFIDINAQRAYSIFDIDKPSKSKLKNISEAPTENADYNLQTISEIISKYPNNARSYQLRGKIFFRGLGNIDKAVFDLNKAQNLLTQVQVEQLNDSLANFYENIKSEINWDLDAIESNFGDLKFRIQGVTISRLCRIEDVEVLFQYNQEVYNQAIPVQRKRLDFLKNKLENINFQFSEWDSVRQEMFFEISYFPIINTDVIDPYKITINNRKRYHFNFLGTDEEPKEISWQENYMLTESLPNNMIGLMYDDMHLNIQYPEGLSISRQPFIIQGENQNKYHYFPVSNEYITTINLKDYRGRHIRNIFTGLTKLSLTTIIASTFLLIRWR